MKNKIIVNRKDLNKLLENNGILPPIELINDFNEIMIYFPVIKDKRFLRKFRTLGSIKFKEYINDFYINNSKDIKNKELYMMMFNTFIDKWNEKNINNETCVFLNYDRQKNDIKTYISNFKKNYQYLSDKKKKYKNVYMNCQFSN